MNDQTTNAKFGERIAKVIARAGLTSRREAEEWIATGRVAVNGTVIDSPALNVTSRDRISVDGEPLPARAITLPPRTRTQPTGTSPCSPARRASCNAIAMNDGIKLTHRRRLPEDAAFG